MRRHRTAFSLVELLIVLTVISVMAAMAMPTLEQAREEGLSATCINNLRQTGVAVADYETDFASWALAAYPMIKSPNTERTWDRTLVKYDYIPSERPAITDSPLLGGVYRDWLDCSRWFSNILRCPKTQGTAGLYYEYGGGYGMLMSWGKNGDWYRTHEGPFRLSAIGNASKTVHIAEAYGTFSAAYGRPHAAVPHSYEINEWIQYLCFSGISPCSAT